MAGTSGVTTQMRSPMNRVLLAARSGVFALFILESFTSIILSGGNLANKAKAPVPIEYNIALLIKSTIAFLWMLIVVVQDLASCGNGILASVWCELTWLSIFSVTELGGGIVLVQESTLPGRLCDDSFSYSGWNICHSTTGLSGITLVTGVLLSLYFIALSAASMYHARKYPVFHLLCPVYDFNWFPAAGSDRVKMSYEPSIGSFASSPNARPTPRMAQRTILDIEQPPQLPPVTQSPPPQYQASVPSIPRTQNKQNKHRPPPLKLVISEPLYSNPTYVAPVSFSVEPQGAQYTQHSHYPQQQQRQHTLTRQLPSNNLNQQFRGNYI